jgi:hypothetical protein
MTWQPFFFLNGVDRRNQIAPSTSGIVIATLGRSLGSLIDYIERLFRSKMLHESNSTPPSSTWNSIVVRAKIGLDRLKSDSNAADDLVQ